VKHSAAAHVEVQLWTDDERLMLRVSDDGCGFDPGTVGGQASRDTFAEGFLLTRNDMDWFEGHYIPDGCDEGDPRISMMRAPDVSNLPQAYVATAGFDPLRDEGEVYASRMREAGVKVALQRHPGLIHGFANLTAICPSARTAMLEVVGALRMGLS